MKPTIVKNKIIIIIIACEWIPERNNCVQLNSPSKLLTGPSETIWFIKMHDCQQNVYYSTVWFIWKNNFLITHFVVGLQVTEKVPFRIKEFGLKVVN